MGSFNLQIIVRATGKWILKISALSKYYSVHLLSYSICKNSDYMLQYKFWL